MDAEHPDERTPPYGARANRMLPAMAWGVSAPWTLIVSALLGVWLMFAPDVFGTTGAFADNDHLLGALIVTVAVIAMAEVVRAGRFLNVLLGAWLIIAPWLLAGTMTSGRWNSIMTGIAVIALSLPRGVIRERYAGWDRYVR